LENNSSRQEQTLKKEEEKILNIFEKYGKTNNYSNFSLECVWTVAILFAAVFLPIS
jgi:hypothetical protein